MLSTIIRSIHLHRYVVGSLVTIGKDRFRVLAVSAINCDDCDLYNVELAKA